MENNEKKYEALFKFGNKEFILDLIIWLIIILTVK